MKKLSAIKDVKTIDDEEEVENFSDNSDGEVEFQPTKHKAPKTKKDFNADFQFVGSTEEYNKDTWNDVSKYVKRKAKTKTDDKIKAALKLDMEDEPENGVEEQFESDKELSDDELQHDKLRPKEKGSKKRKLQQEADAAEVKDSFFEDVFASEENSSFYEMNLSRPLMKAIGEMKFVHPTPIQAATIPVALLGRDICGCAATGTGKTAAYMLPTLERLLFRPVENAVTRVLVLVPTRELGVQVYQVSKQLTQFTDIEIGLSVGGLDLKTQENILRKNPDIVIATPGRLIDHLKSTPSFSLDTIEVLILDEADRMLDEYFAEQMKEIIRQCARTRQTMLFSATMTDEVKALAAVSLNKPLRIFVDSNKEVALNLRQEFVRIRLDQEKNREAYLAALVCRTFRDHCIIFVQTKKQAHRLHIVLGLLSVKVVELHGNLTQSQRLDALRKFKNEEADVLVATDVAARGLDIAGVQTVINFILPPTLEHYIHRVGRTARAGRAGLSVSLVGEMDLKAIRKICKGSKGTLKCRLISTHILEKYTKKLGQLEDRITQILQEEYEERMLAKAENQVKKAQNLLSGEKLEKREWFQSKKQRKEEKAKLALPKAPKDKVKKKSNKKKEDPEDKEVKKVAEVQARMAKRKNKPTKLKSCVEEVARQRNQVKKKKSNFTNELTDTSRKSAKKLRYDANKKSKVPTKKGVKVNKKALGKAFGKPQQKKRK